MNRRKLLRLLGWAATVVAAAPVSDPDTDEQERLVRALAVPSRVDTQVIDHIEGVLQYCKRQEDALGPQAVLHSVLATRTVLCGIATRAGRLRRKPGIRSWPCTRSAI
jgi:hypothetical protein